ncbi:hypothetical protein [Piscibacillus salipiscarius]|uniref:Uncharacterized protein n=1 Tax=Piscibacillus salipiscarius TaxID=299480 RepID=A0ABW5QDI3_9BACI|nr:hypothetical protein [Piscibacillus salipiscarius]
MSEFGNIQSTDEEIKNSRQFYHLDRIGSLEIGKEISLNPIYVNSNSKEISNHIKELFKEGISKHGLQYINALQGNNAQTEWFFEYVRRSNFQDKPSRFQSFFGFSTLDDIERMKSKLNISGGTIYLVQSSQYFRADMNLLGIQQSYLMFSLLANIYWSGETYKELNSKFGFKPLWEYLLTGEIKIIDKIHN